MAIKRYPLDTTGRSPGNLVKGELHRLNGTGNDICFMRNGAFFNEGLVVKQGDKTLKLNKDYVYCFFWQDATYELNAPVSLAIQITNKNLTGEIAITYQVVGGKYQERYEALDKQLESLSVEHTRNVDWGEVLSIPEAFIPTRHLHHINDVYGVQALVEVLYAIRKTIANQSVLKLKTVYDRFLKLKNYVDSNLKENNAYKEDFNRRLKELEALRESLDRHAVTMDQATEMIATAKNELLSMINNLQNEITRANGQQDIVVSSLRTDLQRVETNVNRAVANRLQAIATELLTAVDDKSRENHRALVEIINRNHTNNLREFELFKDKVNKTVDTKINNLISSLRRANIDI